MVGSLASILLITGFNTYEGVPSPNGWPMPGQNKQNTAFQSREHLISPSNVSQLQKKWVYNTDANNVLINRTYAKSPVLGTPSVDQANQTIFFGDLNGRLHAVNAQTGAPVWIKSIVYDYLKDVSTQKNLDISL